MAVNVQLFGVPVEIRPSFAVLIVVLGLTDHPIGLPLALWVLIATVALLVHEFGHASVVLAFGGQPRIILLGSGGATLSPPLGARRLVALAAAGPLAGLVLGAVVLVAIRLAPPGTLPGWVVDDVLLVTVGWSVLNLLPLGQLDGHAVLEALVTVVLSRPPGAVGRFVGWMAVLLILVGTAAAGRYEATFMVAIVAILTGAPLGGLSRLFGAGGAITGPGLLVLGRSEEALAWSEKMLARRPDDLDLLLVRADALRLLTRWVDAEALFSTVLAQRPRSAHALAGRFIVRRAGGRTAEARTDLDALIAIAHDDHAAAGPLFAAFSVDGQLEAAAAFLDGELARPGLTRPERERLTVMRLSVDVGLGRVETALPVIELLIAASPDDLVLHEMRAQARIQTGDLDEARRSADRALVAAPRHPELLETLGVARRLSGHPEAALPALLDAATSRPELPRGRAELSACFTQLGRLEEAAAAIDSLPPRTSDDAHVAYARACLLARLGRSDEAARTLALAARVRPSLGRIAAWDPNLLALRAAHESAALTALEAQAAAALGPSGAAEAG